jgi:hypothetical protein
VDEVFGEEVDGLVWGEGDGESFGMEGEVFGFWDNAMEVVWGDWASGAFTELLVELGFEEEAGLGFHW